MAIADLIIANPELQLWFIDLEAKARTKALEEAAKCAEAWPTNRAGHIWREEIAAAIRALKG